VVDSAKQTQRKKTREHKDCKEEAKHGLKMSAKLWCSEHAIDAHRGIVLPRGLRRGRRGKTLFPMLRGTTRHTVAAPRF